MILCADLVVASRTAVFGDAHARHGIMPAIGATSALVRSAGVHNTLRLLLLSEMIDAETMRRFWIVTEVVEPGGLRERAQEIGDLLATRSPASLALMKRTVQQVEDPDWEIQVARELDAFCSLWGTPQMLEGISAFNERRSAEY